MEDPTPIDVQPSQTLPPVEIRRGTFARLTICEVEESELEILAQGSPDSLYLNFAIFLLSIAIAFFVALLTASISTRVFIVFVVVTTLGLLLGALLLILWLKKRRSISQLVQKIRSRLPPEAIQANILGDLSEERAAELLRILENPDE